MPNLENPHAGTGSVILDIGGDIGALIVTMPACMDDVEVEIVPTGTDNRHTHLTGDAARADHSHSQGALGHRHPADAPPHVAVVPRRAADGSVIHSLVFGELSEGTYDLYVRPHGPVQLTATVVGGQITESRWPQ